MDAAGGIRGGFQERGRLRLLWIALALAFPGPRLAGPAPSIADRISRLIAQGNDALYGRGRSLDYAAATQEFRQALWLSQRTGDAWGIVRAGNNLGVVCEHRHDYPPAYGWYATALRALAGLHKPAIEALVEGELGEVCVALRRWPEAEGHLGRSLEGYAMLNDPGHTRQLALNLLYVYLQLHNPDRVLRFLDRAFSLYGSLFTDDERAYLYAVQGEQYQHRQDPSRAVDAYERAQALAGHQGRGDVAVVLANLSIAYTQVGRFDQALSVSHRLITLASHPPDPTLLGRAHLHLGTVYATLGVDDLAEHHLRIALSQAPALQDPELAAWLPGALGAVQTARHETQAAERSLQIALRLAHAASVPEEEALAWEGLGTLYEREQKEAAETAFRKAAAIWQAQSDRRGLTRTGVDRALLALGRGDRAAAGRLVAQASIASQGLPDPLLQAQVAAVKGRLDRAQHQLPRAEAAFRKALKATETVLPQVGDPLEVGAFEEANQPQLYALYACTLLEQGRQAEALLAVERGQARGLHALVTLNRDGSPRLQDALWQRWEETTDRPLSIAPRGAPSGMAPLPRPEPPRPGARPRPAGAHRPSPGDPRSRTEPRAETAAPPAPGGASADAVLAPVRALLARVPLDPIQLTTLLAGHPDTLYLVWAGVDETTTLLFAAHDRTVQGFRLPLGLTQQARLVRAWRQTIEAREQSRDPDTLLSERHRLFVRSEQEPRAARALSRALLSPLLASGLLQPRRFRHLVVQPDGPLRDVAFGALCGPTGVRLLNQATVSSTFSLRPRPPGIQRAPGFLVVEDPTAARAAVEGTPIAPPLYNTFRPLPQLQAALETIARRGPGPVRRFAGPSARKADVQHALPSADVLVFGAHGVLEPDHGLQSYLQLAPDPRPPGDDGRLTAREILQTPLPARLVVLAACESARGQSRGGEGLVGLAWAFEGAGADAVIGTQWRVEDESAARLVRGLFQRWPAQPLDKALRGAALAVQAEPGHRHPFYWAGFELFDSARGAP